MHVICRRLADARKPISTGARQPTSLFHQPPWLDLHSSADARTRILRLLADAPAGCTLEQLLPDAQAEDPSATGAGLRRRSAWTSIFTVSLELARQGVVALAQEATFSAIHVSPAPVAPSA